MRSLPLAITFDISAEYSVEISLSSKMLEHAEAHHIVIEIDPLLISPQPTLPTM